jgi:hypothetical protein
MAFDSTFEFSGGDIAGRSQRAAFASQILGAWDAGKFTASGPAANISNGGSAAGGGAPAVVKADVTHNNPPPGTSTKVTSSSPSVSIGTLKVVKSMAGGSL